MRTRVHHLLEEAAARHGARPALTSGQVTRTYDEVWGDVRSVAAGLIDLGVVRGDRVAVFLDKRIETVVSMLASSLAEAAFVPVNPVFKPRQVAHVVRDSGSVVLVTTERRWATLAAALRDVDLRHVVLIDRDPTVVGADPVVGDVTLHPYARLSAPIPGRVRPRGHPTWIVRRSSTPRAAPDRPRVWCSATATSWWVRRA